MSKRSAQLQVLEEEARLVSDILDGDSSLDDWRAKKGLDALV